MAIEAYLTVIWRRKWLVLLTMVVAAAVAVIGSRTVTPTYTAQATVRVAQVQSDGVSFTTLSYTERIMKTYAQLLTSRAIVRRVAEAVEPEMDPEQLMRAVTVEVIPETELLAIAVENTDPHVAMALANELALVMVHEGQGVFYGENDSISDALRAELDTIEAALTEDRTTLASLSRRAETQQQIEPDLEVAIRGLQRRIQYREETYASLLAQSDRLALGQRLLATAISVADPAVLPQSSNQPSTRMLALLSAVLGLAGGIGLALVSDHLDSHVRSARQLEELTGLDVIMAVPALRLSRRQRKDVVRLDHSHLEVWEAYRALGTMVLTEAQSRGARSLLIASADAQAGRSTITLNVAISLAESGWRITVVDSDLRSPELHRALGIPSSPGLSNVLRGQCLLRDALAESGVPGLRVLTSGPVDPAPDRIANASTLGPVLRELEAVSDLVLLDSPPILQYADALELATVAHRVLLVAAEGQSVRGQVVEAARRLARTNSAIAGMVLNRAHRARAGASEDLYRGGRPAEGGVWTPQVPALAARPGHTLQSVSDSYE